MKAGQLPVEQFPVLRATSQIVHGFTLRVPGVEVSHDKVTALQRLDGVHREVLRERGLQDVPLVTAQQIHGNSVAVVSETTGERCYDGCDGLVTDRAGLCLGIYVADCCAVFVVDPVRKAIGLLHSGKKGTALAITSNAIELMMNRFGSRPADLIVQLSPCIRPPHYEIDFATTIVKQCRDVGVTAVNDCGTCTACDLERYYSYRAEKGRTGRMLAFLALT